MKEVCEVTVNQNGSTVKFVFNDVIDALRFAETCLETSDPGTAINTVMKEIEP